MRLPLVLPPCMANYFTLFPILRARPLSGFSANPTSLVKSVS